MSDKTSKVHVVDFEGFPHEIVVHVANITVMETQTVRGFAYAQMLAEKTQREAGWYDGKEFSFPETTALIHSELSEALEADRKNLMDDKLPHRHGIEGEWADAFIRMLAAGGKQGYNLGATVVEKNRYNMDRADHKKENRDKAGGKSY